MNVKTKLLLLLIGLFPSNQIIGQTPAGALHKQESAGYWVGQGDRLTNGGQHARAYSAFQLARSLGAPNMVPRMELARRRGIRQVQLQALLAQAEGMAGTDPVQGLRLLEHAYRYFPDSSRILQEVGALVNQPTVWLHQLKADGLWGSPRLRFVIANNPTGLLYERQADSLVARYRLNRPVIRAFFSPDERYVWVITEQESLLVDCRGRLVTQTKAGLTAVVFSSDNRYALLTYADEPVTRLWQFRDNRLIDTGITQSTRVTERATPFSPDGQYVQILSAAGASLWRLTDTGPQRRSILSEPNKLRSLIFSPVGSYFVGTVFAGTSAASPGLIAGRFESDTVQVIRRFQQANSRLLTNPFSPDGRWLMLTFQEPKADSLWRITPNGLLPHSTFQHTNERDRLRVFNRFSPDGNSLLRSSSVPGDEGNAQLWRLTPKEARLLHQFQQKSTILDDVFSPDCRYLLSQHTSAIGDSLWQISDDGLQPVFGFRATIRASTPGKEGGPVLPESPSPFSPDGRLLLTFHEGATPDSLWLITKIGLQPLYGFRERLDPTTTCFSSDNRSLLGVQTSSFNGILWSLSTLDIARHLQFPGHIRDALFSVEGTYLLCQMTGVADSTYLYRYSGGRFYRQQGVSESVRLADSRFLANDNYLFSTGRSSILWRLTASGLERLHQFQQPLTNRRSPLGGARTEQVYVDWLASPDGRYVIAQSDSLWFLTNGTLLAVKNLSLRLANRSSSPGLDGENGRYTLMQVAFAGQEPMLWGQTTDKTNVLYQLRKQTAVPISLPASHQTLLGYSSAHGYGLFAPSDATGPVRLWQYTARRWQPRQTLPSVREAFTDDWPDRARPNLISPDGNLLLIPGTDNRLQLFRLTASGATLLTQTTASIRSFAFLPVSSGSRQPVGLFYSTIEQTYLLLATGQQTRLISLGSGTLRKAPVFQGRWAYLTRRQTDGQTTVDILDWVTGTLVSSVTVRDFLDTMVTSDGTAWAMTTAGLIALYHPTERLHWLIRAPVAGLTPALRQQYAFDGPL